ncbi:thioredoxin domain-containing protein 9 homolog [Benincasa hispida]|uniref:thioredoxin domain-containing protein 9 homolog n=1 Tax=Benincasa hispida TaxID=102211 RepID=UPI001902B319|nr:thioredoxin domain-containing protein 9 homolog [Benincasa hispida]
MALCAVYCPIMALILASNRPKSPFPSNFSISYLARVISDLIVYQVMDKHLSILAKQHIETRFVKINAEKSPFLAKKLKIVVLPTLALIKNTKVDDYLAGFDKLGGTDEFSTEELEDRWAKCQVIFHEGESSINASKSSAQTKRSVRQSTRSDSSDSE